MARARGLDPRAVLAVAAQEGLGGGIGDNGTSFGPFQLHYGGAYPSSAPRGAQASQAWAWSRQGIAYALDAMARVAGGQHGAQAVKSIVSKFERPADPRSEIQGALAAYGQTALAAPGGQDVRPNAAEAGYSSSESRAPGAASAVDSRHQLALALLSQVGKKSPDYSGVFDVLKARNDAQAPMPGAPAPGAPAPVQAPGGAPSAATINELFYDPIGGIKHGQSIGAIDGHSDHVHIALSTLQAQQRAEQRARALGLTVGEETDKDVHPVHVKTSYHYKAFPGSDHREAADISGDAAHMAAFYKWVKKTFG